MRRLVGVLAAMIWSSAAIGAPGMCEYAHPANPSWNFFASCDYVAETGPAKVTTRAKVSNGSVFTIETIETTEGTRTLVNGRAAQPVAREGSECFRTETERETICVHPEGTAAPERMVAEAPAVAPGSVAMGAPTLGGGSPGYCLLTSETDEGAALVDQSSCLRARNCQTSHDGVRSCLALHVWKNGRETGLYSFADGLALDGTPAVERGEGCVAEEGGALVFCFSKSPFAADRIPAQRVETPVTPSQILPAEIGGPTVEDTELTELGEAELPAATGVTCRFLKSGVEIANMDCTEVALCDGDSCTVTYGLDGGGGVVVTVISGKARVIDGIATGPVDWVEGAPVCLGYAATPLRFCVSPKE